MRKILLVEDHEPHAELISYHLIMRLGHSVKHVTTLQEAMWYLGWCDNIILDLNLPDSRGIDTLKKVMSKSMKPVIVITSSLESEVDMKECLALGAFEFINKAELLDKLERYLTESGPRQR